MQGMRLYPIGRTECEDGVFRIVLDRKYAAALEGLEGFSHAQLLWWFDGCDNESARSVLQNTKPYTKGPDTLGTFATRSPERPNPIGLSVVHILSVDRENGVLTADYLDALPGTPVLDIKPYTPSLDRAETAKVPAWCAHWPRSCEDSEFFDWENEFYF